jgi:two-component system nitrogen regulation response regulator NtrX
VNSVPTVDTLEITPGRIIAISAAMRFVLQEIARAAERQVHVLLSGEPGSGRQVIARAIHAHSKSASGPFVVIDCARRAPNDLESQLFATTGNRAGVERRSLERVRRSAQLLQSKGGTLFLQNAADLPARIQLRLVRVLRDGEVVIMDDGARVELEHRIITSADRSLDSAVQDGRMLPDLHKRLCEFRIDVPALRDRREDVAALAGHLIAQLCSRANVPVKQLSDPAKSLLAALPWRGNGDELSRLVEVLVTRIAPSTISLDDVLANVRLDGQATWFGMGGTLREARARFESEYIAAVVAQHNGRIPEAAKTLGIQRSNLYRKMRHLRVRPNPRRAGRQPQDAN